MEVILGYVRIEVLRKALRELDMDAQEKMIRRLHKDGMSTRNLELLLGVDVEKIEEIIERPPKRSRKLKVDKEGLNKYDQFIQEYPQAVAEDLVEEFGISKTYASTKLRDYERKTQVEVAHGDVVVNGELVEHALVIQFPLVEQLEKALEEGDVLFSADGD